MMTRRIWLYLLLGMLAAVAWASQRAGKSGTASLPQQQMGSPQQAASPAGAALPVELARASLEPANRDPFAAAAPPPPPPAPKTSLPVVVVPVAPPSAPPLNLAFTGRMTAPDGSQLVFASFGDTQITLAPGQTLPNGYQVTSITDNAVELAYPALNTKARLDLPAPPKYEIR